MDAAIDVDAMARTIVDEISFVVPTTVDPDIDQVARRIEEVLLAPRSKRQGAGAPTTTSGAPPSRRLSSTDSVRSARVPPHPRSRSGL
jgi:hypothetical protein